jgi:hypothetical protein
MKTYAKVIHRIILSTLFSILTWIIVKSFIIEITFLRYFLVELILYFSMNLLKFTLQKFKIHDETE